jgi:hypothetical protein
MFLNGKGMKNENDKTDRMAHGSWIRRIDMLNKDEFIVYHKLNAELEKSIKPHQLALSNASHPNDASVAETILQVEVSASTYRS